MAAFDLGYNEERFEKDVDDNFHCAICFNVLKDPVSCQRNQHCFCTPCITRHLQNSNTCPSCRDELTVETLSQAPRVLTNYLSTLKIRCDFFERGCVGFHRLGDLKRHAEDCGFASVFCSNDGCRVEICKRDRTHHEVEVCEFRKLKCHDCAALRKEVEEVKMSVKEQSKDIEGTREDLASVKDQMTKLPDLLHGIKEEMIKDIGAMMAEMKDEFKQSRRHLGQGQLQNSCLNSVKEDIIIAGGRFPDGGVFWTSTNSVEMFVWSTKSWVSLNLLKQGRAGACSFVYENSLFVAGGSYGPFLLVYTDIMERMHIGHQPEQWTNFPAKLPTTNKDFKSVVYKDRLIITGGCSKLQGCLSSINELLLVPPYSARLLTTMPQPRILHGAELMKDKIFIVGGSTSSDDQDALDSVLVYDIITNECKEMAPLPFPVSRMATVSKGDNVVLIGGKDKNNKVLNTVVMYDTNTGKNEVLPEMKYCRFGCSAVITGNVIVVMGGFDESGNELSTVESFEFSCYEWKDLPHMKVARAFATAVAKPGNFTWKRC